MTSSSHETGWSDQDAARLLLGKLGVRPADLVAAPAMVDFPLIADYLPLVEKAVGEGTRRVYGPYWAKVVREWGHRRVNEPTALEISRLNNTATSFDVTVFSTGQVTVDLSLSMMHFDA
jgi:hypothetical protein